MSDHLTLDELARQPDADDPHDTIVREPSVATARLLASIRNAEQARGGQSLLDMKTLIGTPPAPSSVSVRRIRSVQETRELAVPAATSLTSTLQFAAPPVRAAPPDERMEPNPTSAEWQSTLGCGTTREISASELERELALIRPTFEPDAPAGRAVRREPHLQVTREFELDELVPALPALGEAIANVQPLDPSPTVITRAPEFVASVHTRSNSPSAAPVVAPAFEPPLPSVAPPPQSAARTRGWLVGAAAVVATVTLGASFYAKQPPGTGRAWLERALHGSSQAKEQHAAPPPPPNKQRTAHAATAPAAPLPHVDARAAEEAAQQVRDDKQALFAQPERAAQLYVEGRYKEALAEYRMLATFHPDQPIYADFARVLKRRLVETCIRTQPHRQAECSKL